MAATQSTMQALGTDVPEFDLTAINLGAERFSPSLVTGKPMLVMFICNHCPYVVHIAKKLAEVANQFQQQGFAVVAINSNDVENYPADSPEKMLEFAAQYQFEFPYCFDESQEVAKQFAAACTPDFFVYDQQHQLVYRGQFDGSRPGNQIAVTGNDLSTAMQNVLDGVAVSEQQIPSLGCNIKWKPDSV